MSSIFNTNPKQCFTKKGFGFAQFGASVLIGLFENISITNGFLDVRASNVLVFLHGYTLDLPWIGSDEQYSNNSNRPILS